MFCLFPRLWLPSLPRSGVAWSRLSSALFIVYLLNEGGGTRQHVIGSSNPPTSSSRRASWLSAAIKEEGIFYLSEALREVLRNILLFLHAGRNVVGEF